jgi:hypothetical protein
MRHARPRIIADEIGSKSSTANIVVDRNGVGGICVPHASVSKRAPSITCPSRVKVRSAAGPAVVRRLKARVQIVSRSATGDKRCALSGLENGICGGPQPPLSAALEAGGLTSAAEVLSRWTHQTRSGHAGARQCPLLNISYGDRSRRSIPVDALTAFRQVTMPFGVARQFGDFA